MPGTLLRRHFNVYGSIGVRVWSLNTIQNTTFETYFTDLKSESAAVRPD